MSVSSGSGTTGEAHRFGEAFGPQYQTSAFRWATVTDDVPLTIRLDGDSQPLPIVPDSLIEGAPPAVGKRVWVQLFGRRVIVIGVSAAP